MVSGCDDGTYHVTYLGTPCRSACCMKPILNSRFTLRINIITPTNLAATSTDETCFNDMYEPVGTRGASRVSKQPCRVYEGAECESTWVVNVEGSTCGW